ncbi:hypothetical protein GWK47_019154 [Chionoecetes opilio]|uniref:TNFR-Cys domain-containing protein n=1 Tax=Chionoecetes opilio TaxID=41210 RepID=A0A8J5CG23_CHIOP|nr:hypothetical protein GWK47_019154 [Chionoecetes opilio]
MVGRGWWVLAWTVCAGWTVDPSGSLSCHPGQEYFSGRQGQCVPCTRCHDPQVVVVPCYVYQDAVCAPAAQFVPNWPQPGPQLPITLSTSPAPHVREARVRGKHTAAPSERETQPRKTNGKQEKSHGGKSASRKNNNRAQSNSQSDSEKSSKKHPRHNHRHRQRQDLRPQNRSGEQLTEEFEVNSVIVHKKSGGNRAVDTLPGDGNSGVVSRKSGGGESGSSGGGGDETQDSDVEQPEVARWKETFFFVFITIVSICLVLLTIATLSHLRNILTRRKLKRVYDGLPSARCGEARVMEQLLPSAPECPGPAVATRGTVTYIRATTATASTPSSPTLTTTMAAMSAEAHPTPAHVYPINPFTMDRLLEQRRVLGPASSVDTNLYVESWQQQDSQAPGSTAHCAPGPCVPPRGSVSACPSPAPVRSYRPGPASASASPTVSVRGLNIPRGPPRGGLAAPLGVVSGGLAGGCS